MPLLIQPSGGLLLSGGLVSGTPAAAAVPPTVPIALTQWVRASAAASGGATTISVDILGAAMRAGTTLTFSGGTTATLTTQANAGDSLLAVSALAGAIAAGETASGSVNLVMVERVSPVMPAPVIDPDTGRPGDDWWPTGVTVENVGSLQVLVGPKGSTPTDITYWRDVPVGVPGWSSADPFGDGTATIRIPQWTVFDEPGVGAAAWLVKRNAVTINNVDEDGLVDAVRFEGQVLGWDVEQTETSTSLVVTCRGAGLQIADFRRAPATSNADVTLDDVFRLQYDNSLGVRPSLQTEDPRVDGGPTGITSRTNAAYQSILEYLIEELAKATTDTLDQWTILLERPRTPVLQLRDRTTVHHTLTAGTPGLSLRLTQDYTDARNVMYAESEDEAGSLVRNLFPQPVSGSPYFEPFGFLPEVHNTYVDESTGQLYDSGSIDTSVGRVEGFFRGEGLGRADLTRLAGHYVSRDSDPGWFGTMTLRIDPEAGSRFAMAAGQNVLLKHFAGSGAAGLLFHIAGCEADYQNLTVRLTVDTKARDLLALEEIIKRNRAGTSPARQLRAGQQSGIVEDKKLAPWDNEAGSGWVPTRRKFDGTSTMSLTANTWHVEKILMSGGPDTIVKLTLAASVDTPFGAYLFDWNINTANLPSDPFAHADTWANPPIGYINGWGVKNQRGGFYPGAETRLDDGGNAITTDTPTGLMIIESTWSYGPRRGTASTVDGSSVGASVAPFMYLAVYALATCTMQGRFEHG